MFCKITANVPPALCCGGFLLLMFTNIPKSGKKKLLFKEEMQALTNPKKTKPRHSIKPLLGAVSFSLHFQIINLLGCLLVNKFRFLIFRMFGRVLQFCLVLQNQFYFFQLLLNIHNSFVYIHM